MLGERRHGGRDNRRGSRVARRRTGHLESLEPRLALDSTVVFNEIMYNPAGADETLEWVELHNQMGVNMDLSGWRLDGGVGFPFPNGTTLARGGYLVIASNPAALQAATASAYPIRTPNRSIARPANP